MNFIDWIKSQNQRKDEIGWLSRQFITQFSISPRKSAFKQLTDTAADKSSSQLTKFASTWSQGKIRRAFQLAVSEWLKTARISPQTGIYWVIDGDVVEISQDAHEQTWQAGFKDSPYDHITYWPKIRSLYPSLKHKDYDEVPRGRVIAVEPDIYRVFIPAEDAGNTSLINKVIKTFQLPRNKVQIIDDDPHYWTSDNSLLQEDEDFEEYNFEEDEDF